MSTSSPAEPRPICDYEDSTYRTDFWEGQGREYEDRAERVALAKLLPPNGTRLLDIGAGFGRLAGMYDGYDEVILLDYSKSQLEFARERLGDGRFIYVVADIYRLPLATNVVDTTVMVRVLHHLADVPLAFQQIARVIRLQGTFVLEFANKRHLKNILRYLMARQANPFTPDPYEFAPLHFDFHPQWVAGQLQEAGFGVGRRLSVSLFRAGALKRSLPLGMLVALDGALQAVTAPLTLGPSLFVRSCLEKTALDPLPPAGGARARLFRCPDCGLEGLQGTSEGLHCSACGALWPIENGIYVFKRP